MSRSNQRYLALRKVPSPSRVTSDGYVKFRMSGAISEDYFLLRGFRLVSDGSIRNRKALNKW